MVACGVFALLGLVGSIGVDAKGKPKDKPKVQLKVKVGDPLPAFESVDESGQPFKSSDVVGRKVVVFYFYGADFSGNAVAQARGYQDALDQIGGAVVYGISGDSPGTHKLFKDYYKLPYSLLADVKGDFAAMIGIPVGKGGKSATINAKNEKGTAERGVTIDRWTVVVDAAGKIAAIDPVKTPGDDGKRVAEIVKKLNAK
jgi:peroxiredoxin Q/BCP